MARCCGSYGCAPTSRKTHWRDGAPSSASHINRLESGERNRPTREVVDAFARALGLGQINADRLLVSAGYLPSYSDDLTVRQLAVLLADSTAPVVATLRAQIAASYRVLAAGQEGAAK